MWGWDTDIFNITLDSGKAQCQRRHSLHLTMTFQPCTAPGHMKFYKNTSLLLIISLGDYLSCTVSLHSTLLPEMYYLTQQQELCMHTWNSSGGVFHVPPGGKMGSINVSVLQAPSLHLAYSLTGCFECSGSDMHSATASCRLYVFRSRSMCLSSGSRCMDSAPPDVIGLAAFVTQRFSISCDDG